MRGCQGEEEENLPHALFYCQANDRVGLQLLECLREIQPGLQAEAILRLEMQVEESLELPIVWLTATVLNTLWKLRQSSTKVRQYLVRSQFEAQINLLRETSQKKAAARIEELASNLFT